MTTTYTLAEAISNMRTRGYVTTFTIQRGLIFCPELNATIAPENLTLLERHVIEAQDSKDKREIYGFRTKENVMGIMTNTYADFDQHGFTTVFQQFKKEQKR